MSPVTYGVDAQDRVLDSNYPDRAKVADLRRDPAASFVSLGETLDDAESTRTSPDAIVDLRDEVDGTLLVLGSSRVVRALARHDLVDTYRLLVYPVLLGAGKRMFDHDSGLTRFVLTESSASASGVVMLTYTRDRSGGATIPVRDAHG